MKRNISRDSNPQFFLNTVLEIITFFRLLAIPFKKTNLICTLLSVLTLTYLFFLCLESPSPFATGHGGGGKLGGWATLLLLTLE